MSLNRDELIPQAEGSLYFLPSALQSTTTLGLSGGTIYDVLDANTGTGNVTVEATGFNVTCRYLTDFSFKFDFAQFWLVTSTQFTPDGGHWPWMIEPTGRFYDLMPRSRLTLLLEGGAVAILDSSQVKGTLFYSTAQIVDSSGKAGLQANLTANADGVDFNAPVQLLSCSQSLVRQKAVVDAQSHELLSVAPNITKTASTWSSPATIPSIYEETVGWPSLGMPGTSLMDLAPMFYDLIPGSAYARVTGGYTNATATDFSVGDIFLSQQLDMLPLYNNQTPIVPLHELENALSVIFASMMWTVGNIPLPSWYAEVEYYTPKNLVYLLKGSASVTEQFLQTRLDLNEIAVIAGLVASIALALLSLPSTIFHQKTQDDQHIPIDGTGILHAIWLYRNRPELETLLEQVEHPTDKNLREAGLVRTSLVGGGLHSRKRRKSF
ncbi:hypothetical protein DFH09DRAFT_1073277 [Mycena vulgaris]|nr:hypothetical protein DFH09DRAFT_1073277 [Mycena vulgaris]